MRRTVKAVLKVFAVGGLLAIAAPAAQAGNGGYQGGHHNGNSGGHQSGPFNGPFNNGPFNGGHHNGNGRWNGGHHNNAPFGGHWGWYRGVWTYFPGNFGGNGPYRGR